MVKKSYKPFLLILTYIFALSIFLTSFSYKSPVSAATNEITVFSWDDYIDEDLLDEFETKTGISVNYNTFATNEEMYNELLKAPTKVDLICPSEYMIMKMISEDLIKKYEMPSNYKDYGSEYIKGVFDSIKMGEEKLSDYAIGYMWGTMGFLYNKDHVDANDIKHWNGIWSDKYKNKTTIKDSVRDTYILMLGKIYEEELLALDVNDPLYNEKLTEIFNRTDDVSIEKVGMELSNLKDYIYGYEVDSGKSDILTGKIDINFAWSGDAVYTIDEGEDAGLNLGYIVPEEGSNVWFDGWVMPKAAKEAQALEFLNFLCEPENAVRNMDYIGYTSCVAGDEVFEYAYGSFTAESEVIDVASYNELDDELKAEYGLYNGEYYCAIDVDEEENNIYGVLAEDALGVYLETFSLDAGVKVNVKREEVYKTDLKYFFDKNDTTGKYVIYSLDNDRQLFAQYANEEVIRRCAVMKQFDNETLEKINAMWNREKLITLPTYALILFGVAVVALIIVYFLVKFRAKIFKRNIPKTETQSNKNGMKVISKEML